MEGIGIVVAGYVLLAFALGFVFGNVLGKALGFADARGRFTKKD